MSTAKDYIKNTVNFFLSVASSPFFFSCLYKNLAELINQADFSTQRT